MATDTTAEEAVLHDLMLDWPRSIPEALALLATAQAGSAVIEAALGAMGEEACRAACRRWTEVVESGVAELVFGILGANGLRRGMDDGLRHPPRLSAPAGAIHTLVAGVADWGEDALRRLADAVVAALAR